jgi:hypothetical protein
MAFLGAINFFDVSMGYFIEPVMTAFASQIGMNRIGKHLFINIEYPLAGFVIPPHHGISVAIEAILRVRNCAGLGRCNPGIQNQE